MFNTKGKKERSLGVNLFLRPERSNSPKSVMVRRPYPPGLHGKKRRARLSEFGQQLKEKQKFRFAYGLREASFRRLVGEAMRSPGVTGEMIVRLLEQRLDNIVYRLGFAPSRSVARQLINHGHILVNGKKTNIPSRRVRERDVVGIRPQSKDHTHLKDLGETLKKYETPPWLTLDKEKLEGILVSLPKDSEIPFDANMVVDYYSKIIK